MCSLLDGEVMGCNIR